jgi:hypothetical protein
MALESSLCEENESIRRYSDFDGAIDSDKATYKGNVAIETSGITSFATLLPLI